MSRLCNWTCRITRAESTDFAESVVLWATMVGGQRITASGKKGRKRNRLALRLIGEVVHRPAPERGDALKRLAIRLCLPKVGDARLLTEQVRARRQAVRLVLGAAG